MSIHYRIGSSNPAGHYFDISMTIDRPDPDGQLLRLPAWIPGSYMIRDFARNITDLKATSEHAELVVSQIDKSTWQLPAVDGAITIDYRVYAWDLSVRTAHLDTTHGFFNGSSVFLEVVGQGDQSGMVTIQSPEGDAYSHWRIATTMTPMDDGATYSFQNYLELIDHPVEMGDFTQFDFEACGVPHSVVLSGRFECDESRLTEDLTRICEYQIQLFGEPAPMSRYLFLVMVVGDGYGGLEHRSSTSLLCSRKHLPQPGQAETTADYREFLGLCSHEYFHSWNVKRITPQVFQQPDLSAEVYTPLLWAFEGITSYYDDLVLLRCGCINIEQYLELLGQTITRVQRGQGRLRQSAAESSFNAWTKFYKQDENAANTIVSYYAKGSLIALCIDMKIRQLTRNQHSLDDVMRRLWSRYLETGKGVDDNDIQGIISDVAGVDLQPFLDQWIKDTEELPLVECLQSISIGLKFRANSGHQDKGGKDLDYLPKSACGMNVVEGEGGLKVMTVSENQAAQQSGLSAGDLIIAINGLKASIGLFQNMLQYQEPGSRQQLTAFRRDELMSFDMELDSPLLDTAVLQLQDPENSAYLNWLGRGDD